MTMQSYYVERYPRTNRRAPSAAFPLLLPALVYVASGAGQPCRHDLRCTLTDTTPEIQQAPGPWRYLSAGSKPAAVGPRMVCYSGGAK